MKNIIASVLFCFLLLMTSPCLVLAEPDNIDVALFKNVPLLVQKLREKELRKVGVLPFRFKDNQGMDQTAGALIQSNLAARTEQVIAYIRDVDDPVDTVFNMLSQARSQDPNAAFQTDDERRRLLSLTYKFPVEEISPSTLDGYVTGVIEVSEDWKKSNLYFEYYDLKTGKLETMGPFTFPTDRKMLMQFGRAYSLSAAGWNPKTMGVQTRSVFAIIDQDEQSIGLQSEQESTKSEPVKTTVLDKPWAKFPVTLTIKYDGQPQSFLRDVYASPYNLSIADPAPKQRVTFELRNNLAERVAVVLAVNGVNLIYQENANDPDSCNKFVLEPQGAYTVPGIYLEGLKSYQPLIGLDNSSTTQIARDYPANAVGVISFSIYREVPEIDPGGVTHLTSQEPNAGAQNTSAGNLKLDSEKQTNSKPSLDFLPNDENENWHNRFQASLIRAGGTQTAASGSFHPTLKSTTAKTWRELSKAIGQNAMQANGSRGLIVPANEIRQQKFNTVKLGAVSQTDVAIIRYLSVVRSKKD